MSFLFIFPDMFYGSFQSQLNMLDDLTDVLVNTHYVVEHELISTGCYFNMVKVNCVMQYASYLC